MLQSLQLHLLQLIARFRRDEGGAALVEYGLLVGLIAVICVVAITAVGTRSAPSSATLRASWRRSDPEPD